MNIFIELPTWLGDTIMTTPAIDGLIKRYPGAKLTLFGSKISLEALKTHPNCIKIIHDESKKSHSRIYWIYKNTKALKYFDMAVSFRGSFMSRILLYFLKANKKMQYDKKLYTGHQVEKYAKFLNVEPMELKLYHKPFDFCTKTVGLNPGATYGSAKRWYPKEFAKTANELSKKYGFKIIIFGGPNEVDIAKEIEENLNTKNYINLAGKTDMDELIQKVAGVNLFITNDSGPMHIAAAYQVPTVAIFGPTNYKETSPWMHSKGIILSKNLECSPCMKRVCPLKHHNCMKEITYKDVLSTIEHHQLLGK
jgi:heptosyltransferase-2